MNRKWDGRWLEETGPDGEYILLGVRRLDDYGGFRVVTDMWGVTGYNVPVSLDDWPQALIYWRDRE